MTVAQPAAQPVMEPKDIRSVIIGLMMVMLLAALDQTIVSTALPTIGRELHDIEHLPWMVTSYLLSSTVVTPLYGKLADIIGRRTTLLIAIGVFLAGSALCGLADNLYFLIFARAVQGLGGGGLMSLVQTVIADVVTPAERGRLQGYFAAVFTASSLGGPVLGGVMSDYLGWASIFWINIPVGFLALWIVHRGLMKLPRYERAHKLDWIGAAFMAIAAVTLLLALETRGSVLYGAPVWAVYAVSIVFWLLFGLRLRFAEEPLIPTEILKSGAVVRATLMSTMVMGGLMGVGIYNPLYLQLTFGLKATVAGLCLAPLGLGAVTGAILSGRMLAKTKGQKYKTLPLVGLAVAAVIYALLAVFPDLLPLWGYLGVLIVANGAVGTTFPVSIQVVQGSVDRHQVGTATGVMNFFRSLGGALVVAVFGVVLFSEVYALMGTGFTGDLSVEVLDGIRDPALLFRPIFVGAAIVMGLGFAVFATLKETPLRGTEQPVTQAVESVVEPLEGADFSDGPKR